MSWPATGFATRIRVLQLLCFWGFFAAIPPWQLASAQMNMSGHMMETQDQTPPEKLPVPQKMSGIGNSHMHITASPEAQMWFDQGLNLYHDFWDYESARAFEQSIRVDPQCAICYWGLYEAESVGHPTSPAYADPALAKAIALKGHAGKRERLYIEATVASKTAAKKAGPGSDSSSALKLWRKLAKKYPRDTQARIFLAQHTDAKERLAILESVLKEDPENSAANHYYIHALEPTDHPERALHSAEILASLAPASGHMVHMPGHIFFRLGDYARAEHAFAASMEVDEHYMQEQHVRPDYDWNYVHNLMYAVTNLMEEGKLREATAISARLTGARGELEPTFYIYSPRDSISRLDSRLPVALRTADWAQVLQLLKSPLQLGDRPVLEFLARQITQFATGMQAVEAHDLALAEESSYRLDAELWRSSQHSHDASKPEAAADHKSASGPPKLQVAPDAQLPPLISSLSIMSLELRASLLTAQQQATEAKTLFAQAQQQEKELGYREPPGYIRPVAETEAAALMAVADWKGAKAAYGQALSERPKSGFPLYGLALCSERAGDSEAAAKEYSAFVAAWKNADPDLTQITHAQTYLAEHPAIAGSPAPAGPKNSKS